MKKNFLLAGLALGVTTFNAQAQCTISDQSVSAGSTQVCSGGSTTIGTGSSESGVLYYLRNDADNSIISGPTIGNGSGLTFNTGVIPATTTYNVYAERTGALSFDGVDDVVSFGTTMANLPALENYTFEAWVYYVSGTLDISYKFHHHQVSINTSRGIYFNWGNNVSCLWQSGGINVAPGAVPANQWCHVAVVEEYGSGLTFYVNGNPVAFIGGFYNLHSPCNNDRLIRSTGAGNRIDEVRHWTTNRSQTEIQNNMNVCLTGSEAGLHSYYKFNEGSGTTINDATPNARHGVAQNIAASAWTSGSPVCPACTHEMTTTPTVEVNDADVDVSGNAIGIANGDVTPDVADDTDFGNVAVSATHTFTIDNSGSNMALNISSATLSGANAVNFTLLGMPSTVAAGGTATFDVQFTPNSIGMYTATVTLNSNDCDEAVFAFNVQGNGTCNSLGLNLLQANVSCNGSCDGTATIVPTAGAAPYTYLWSSNANNQTTATATGLCLGVYAVTVADAAGCQSVRRFINIFQPSLINANAAVVSSSCSNNGAISLAPTGGAGGYTFMWSNGANTNNITNLSQGNYTVTITDAVGCSVVKTIYVNGSCFSANISGTNIGTCTLSCTGEATANVTGGTQPYSYAWSNGSNTATTTGLCKGTYKVTVTDANGATTTATVTISWQAMKVNYTSTPSCGNACDGTATVTVVGTAGLAPYTYAWNTNTGYQTTQTATGLCNTAYNCTVTSANGCVVVRKFINVGNTTSCGGTPLVYEGGNTDTAADVLLQEETSNSHSTSGNSNQDINNTLRANDFAAVELFEVFPNPNNGQFTIQIQLADNADATLRIHDVLGRTVYQQTLQGSHFSLPIDGDMWTNGAYFVQLISTNGQTTRKVMIQQ